MLSTRPPNPLGRYTRRLSLSSPGRFCFFSLPPSPCFFHSLPSPPRPASFNRRAVGSLLVKIASPLFEERWKEEEAGERGKKIVSLGRRDRPRSVRGGTSLAVAHRFAAKLRSNEPPLPRLNESSVIAPRELDISSRATEPSFRSA